ncbi:hypothetical protein, partial [Staphylococcus auricularis]|uniref:hypothetical protein n=1 Tax=Staphylococcus auricularis TaxID=29379 RepID=UPI001CD990C3
NTLQTHLKNTQPQYQPYKQQNTPTPQLTNTPKQPITPLTTQLKPSFNQFKPTPSTLSSYQTRINHFKNPHTHLKNNIPILNHHHPPLSPQQPPNTQPPTQLPHKINLQKIKINHLSPQINPTQGSLK